MVQHVITPNRARALRRELKRLYSYYRELRRDALTTCRIARRDKNFASEMDAEDALNAAINARLDFYAFKRRVAGYSVVLGSAWSKRGLANVQRANRSGANSA